jgi:hypothetical protein
MYFFNSLKTMPLPRFFHDTIMSVIVSSVIREAGFTATCSAIKGRNSKEAMDEWGVKKRNRNMGLANANQGTLKLMTCNREGKRTPTNPTPFLILAPPKRGAANCLLMHVVTKTAPSLTDPTVRGHHIL